MEQAAVEQTIIRQCFQQGRPLPQRMQNAPQMWLGSQLYWSAFWDLTTCRTTGLSVAPIPWNAMKEYSNLLELDDEQEEMLYYLVRAMDNAYMDTQAKRG